MSKFLPFGDAAAGQEVVDKINYDNGFGGSAGGDEWSRFFPGGDAEAGQDVGKQIENEIKSGW
jgi:hypothetical protein